MEDENKSLGPRVEEDFRCAVECPFRYRMYYKAHWSSLTSWSVFPNIMMVLPLAGYRESRNQKIIY